jgi:hypothetical protein
MPKTAQHRHVEITPVGRPEARPQPRRPTEDRGDAVERMHAIARGHAASASVKQFAQVLVATLLVAGCPIAFVWWLRASGVVSSPIVSLAVGVGLSLAASSLGCWLWEKRTASGDLLFSELMIWGYLHRWRTQCQLASALDMVGPMSQAQGRARDGLSSKEQAKLLEQLVAGMETRDPYLHGHSQRVARHSWMIARRMRLPRADVSRIRTAAAIHDVGKIRTPTAILHKAGALTDHEYEVIKRHPADGALMADALRDPALAAIVRYHHERLDGTGYPDGLRGDAIPLGARIIAVADTFDAITSERPYRRPRAHKEAMSILREESGTKLDPDVVRAFCGHYAGRAPIALWASLAALPERVLSWLGGGVGSVASAAKVAVVAGLVGGAAVTSSTLGLPVLPKHNPAGTRAGGTSRTHAPARSSTGVATLAGPRTSGTPGRRLSARPRHGGAAPTAHGVTPGRPSSATSQSGLGAPGAIPSQGKASKGPAPKAGGEGGSVKAKAETRSRAGAETTNRGRAEPPRTSRPQTPSTGRPETPSAGQSQPSGAARSEPSSSARAEAAIKEQPSSATSPSEEHPAPASTGTGAEPRGKQAAAVHG